MVTTWIRAETEPRRRVCCLHDKGNNFYGPSQLASDDVRQNAYTCIFAQDRRDTGYMEIFAGTITGIRNPKAHDNIVIDEKRAIHLLYLASLLMYKLDEAK